MVGLFCRFDPPRFVWQNAEPLKMEAWIAIMKKVFRDIIIQEIERVHMVVLYLEGDAGV